MAMKKAKPKTARKATKKPTQADTNLRIQALKLARSDADGEGDATVKRAGKFFDFLSGKAPPDPPPIVQPA